MNQSSSANGKKIIEQVQNGVYIRMALIMTLLGLADPKAPKEGN